MAASALYNALRSRDRRFDGTFFVGVSSTMIYCRPVCRSRLPLERNCTFYRSAAEAERSGYRPCLRCRPERAPGRSVTDATGRLAGVALARIMDGALDRGSVADIARELYVGERHLRRVVRAEYGASPVELAQTQRLLLAKQLLVETDLPVSRVAFASGFTSLSRFNTLFRSRYRLNPTGMRSIRQHGPLATGAVKLLFEYRPPLDWPWLLSFLEPRATPGIEVVRDGAYTRSIRSGEHAGWFTARAAAGDAPAIEVEISESLVPALQAVRAMIRRMFDLDARPDVLAAHFANDDVIGPLAARRPGLRLPGTADGFEAAVRAVVGQQVSVAAARTIAGRIHAAFGDSIDAPDGIERISATPQQLAVADPAAIAALGMPRSRARTLVLLAQRVADGSIVPGHTADIERTVEALCALPGIGPWTAEYIAMRGCQWPDAFPATDLGIRNALLNLDGDAANVARRAEAWRPWRAYAAIHLWNSLNDQAERQQHRAGRSGRQ